MAVDLIGYHPRQEFVRDTGGRRYAAHTPLLRSACRCNGCHQRRYWTPERRAARGRQVAERWAAGRHVVRRNPNANRPERWQPDHDAALRELAGTTDCLTIAERLTAQFGQPRSENAVTHRLRYLGISRMQLRPLSSSEVGRMFGITRETVRVRFVNPGWLVGTQRRGGPYGIRMFTRADLERFVRSYPEAYDPDAIRDPSLKVLALSVTRGRRLLSTTEVAARTGIDHRTLVGWYTKRLVPSARKVRGFRPGAGGAWVIDPGDVFLIRALRDGRADRRRALVEPRRDPLTGTFGAAGEMPSNHAPRFTYRVIDRAEAERLVCSGGLPCPSGS